MDRDPGLAGACDRCGADALQHRFDKQLGSAAVGAVNAGWCPTRKYACDKMRHGVATVPGWPRVAMLPAPSVVLAMAAARVEMPPEEDRAMLFLVDSSSESEGDSEALSQANASTEFHAALRSLYRLQYPVYDVLAETGKMKIPVQRGCMVAHVLVLAYLLSPASPATTAYAIKVHGWLELCRKHLEQENPRSTLSSILRPGTVWCGQRGCLDMRGFATASVEERVINSVKKRSGPKEYMKLRVEDLRLETENKSAQQSEALKVLEETEVSLDTKWEDLKFDDLDKVEVLLEVEEEFEHVISDADSDAISSVQGVIDYLQKAQANNTWSLGTLRSSEDDGLYSPKAPSGLACVEETAGGPEAISCIAGDFAARRSAEDLLYAYSAEHQIFFSMVMASIRQVVTSKAPLLHVNVRSKDLSTPVLHHTVAAVAFIAAMRMKVRARKEKPLWAAYFQALCSKARPSAVYLYSIFFWREELSKLSTKALSHAIIPRYLPSREKVLNVFLSETFLYAWEKKDLELASSALPSASSKAEEDIGTNASFVTGMAAAGCFWMALQDLEEKFRLLLRQEEEAKTPQKSRQERRIIDVNSFGPVRPLEPARLKLKVAWSLDQCSIRGPLLQQKDKNWESGSRVVVDTHGIDSGSSPREVTAEMFTNKAKSEIDKVAYDLTEFLGKHPGGDPILRQFAFKDASKAFHKAKHSMLLGLQDDLKAKMQMQTYCIGPMVQELQEMFWEFRSLAVPLASAAS
ncbi:Acyl carrier protein [Symbiodinium microadriaticum]|uniref:Acyl carrier protein n=1 Tax=Symbiodinium microadriaticum TaxID=2951 RepID=A0A1Q9CSA7_SYMMI|nr:Acyl carrier protein [Symbiodinium microadriaticum]